MTPEERRVVKRLIDRARRNKLLLDSAKYGTPSQVASTVASPKRRRRIRHDDAARVRAWARGRFRSLRHIREP